jgi:hypothetical protein
MESKFYFVSFIFLKRIIIQSEIKDAQSAELSVTCWDKDTTTDDFSK